MKWKIFELAKFIEFIFNQKVEFGDERYSQINNDFSKFIKTGESYYECGKLVYHYKQEENGYFCPKVRNGTFQKYQSKSWLQKPIIIGMLPI